MSFAIFFFINEVFLEILIISIGIILGNGIGLGSKKSCKPIANNNINK